jgi:AraC-like DNA-binding protein
MTAAIPTIHFDTASLPESQRFDAWRSAVAAYDITRPSGTTGSFEARVDAWTLGDLVVTSNRLSATRFVRSDEKAKADGVDHYTFFLLRQGGAWIGDTGGNLITIGPGQVVVFDLTRPVDGEWTGGECITLGIARPVLDAVTPHVPDLHGAVLDGAAGRLIADHLLSLVRELPGLTEADVPVVTRATVGLIASCVGAAAERRTSAEAARGSPLRHRIRRHIDQRLAVRELTPDDIARDLGLSRSALYRGFATMGGVAAYIRTRRLEAVHVLLNDPNERRSIAEIAYQFGFVSDAHFSRAFRQQFGYSPREARRGTANVLRDLAEVVDSESGPALFRKWMKKIG